MRNFRAIGAAVVVASGLMLAMAGTASAEEAAPVASTGSASTLGGLIDVLATGSSDSGSSVSGGVKVGNGNVAGTPLSTGSAGTGSASTGSAALCATNPTTGGCPK
ncbi:hypothetical protein [Nocardia sp. NPDC050175]|uniref:hypothetical protein n=1 Tax=Nocardia sp. NPDC050175 TaxID=3364317 RepID=UPI00378BC6E9